MRGDTGRASTPEDQRSHRALARWLAAVPAASYDLRLVPAEASPGPALCRRLGAPDLLRALGLVRARNARGHHAYCRPLAGRHLLVDDLTPDALEALRRAHKAAAVVETSPWNYQAWITVAEEDIPLRLASAAARLLARRFGADTGAASGGQLGRCVGTTNRKTRHRRGDGSFPYVLLRHAGACIDRGGPTLLAEAAQLVREATPEAPTAVSAPDAWAGREAAEARRRLISALPPGVTLDRSRGDYAIARRVLARTGDAALATRVVLAGERASSLAGDAARAYATRTVRAAEAGLGRR